MKGRMKRMTVLFLGFLAISIVGLRKEPANEGGSTGM